VDGRFGLNTKHNPAGVFGTLLKLSQAGVLLLLMLMF